jgi:hypothetical protein
MERTRIVTVVPMDPEVIPLVDALNLIPGIKTDQSCSGHGRGGVWVEFYASEEALESLRELLGHEGLYRRGKHRHSSRKKLWDLCERRATVKLPRKEPHERVTWWLYGPSGDAWPRSNKLAEKLVDTYTCRGVEQFGSSRGS